MKDDFEAAAIQAIHNVFSGSVTAGRKHHFRQCLCRQPQNVGGLMEYKEVKKVRLTYRMPAAWAYLTISTADGNMLLNMRILHGTEINITSRLLCPAMDGEPEAYYRDVKYK